MIKIVNNPRLINVFFVIMYTKRLLNRIIMPRNLNNSEDTKNMKNPLINIIGQVKFFKIKPIGNP